MSEHVVTESARGVLRIELRRPEKRNALTRAMYEALSAAFEGAAGDRAARAVLLHGQPDVFCAGNDVQDFREARPEEAGEQALRFLVALSTCPKPERSRRWSATGTACATCRTRRASVATCSRR